jgi:hypothetical protein
MRLDRHDREAKAMRIRRKPRLGQKAPPYGALLDRLAPGPGNDYLCGVSHGVVRYPIWSG